MLFKVFCFIFIGMLLILTNALAVVYDDEGNIIKEEEIKREMNSIYTGKIGCCLCVSGLGIVELSKVFDSSDKEAEIIGLIPGMLILYGVSYVAGNYFDRWNAIESIKAKRRIQKQQELKNKVTPFEQPDSKSARNMKTVYDDDGKIITEDEIKMNMRDNYLTGCGCLGISLKIIGYLGLGITTWGVLMVGITGGELNNTHLVELGIASLVTIGIGYGAPLLGKYVERETAIKKIKEQRRSQKQDSSKIDKESFIPESKILIPLLSGKF